MDIRAIKGRALSALVASLGLLAVVVFLVRAGKSPVLLAIVTVALAGYGLRLLWKLKTTRT